MLDLLHRAHVVARPQSLDACLRGRLQLVELVAHREGEIAHQPLEALARLGPDAAARPCGVPLDAHDGELGEPREDLLGGMLGEPVDVPAEVGFGRLLRGQAETARLAHHGALEHGPADGAGRSAVGPLSGEVA